MTSRPVRLLVLVVALAVLGGGSLLGGGSSSPRKGGVPSTSTFDIGSLVNAFSAGDSANAVRRLEHQLESRPDDPALRAYLGLGYQQLFRETGRAVWLSRSRRAFEAALERGARRDPLALAGLAQLAATQHRFREAERHARAALRIEPNSPTALGALGDALVELGRYGSAFAVYDRLAALGPSVGGYARVARARELLGRRDEAIDALELAIEAGSGIPEQEAWAQSRYGELLLGAGRARVAQAAFRRSLALRPGFPHARAGLAKVELAAGRPRAAARRFELLLRTVPSAEYAVELGDIYLALGAERRAQSAYGRARRFEHTLANHGVRTMLASASLDLDLGVRLPSALQRARRAYREAPNVETLDLMAWALQRNGRCREALRWSQRSLALGTSDAILFFHRGMIEQCLGREQVAQRWFERALALDPFFSARWTPVAKRLARR